MKEEFNRVELGTIRCVCKCHDEVISRLKTKKPHDVIIKLSLYTFDYQNMQKAARIR